MNIEEILNASVLPRLQIRCEHKEGDYVNQTWVYELVYEHFTGDIEKVKMGETRRESGSGDKPIDENGKIDTPIRDGAHILHDSIQLNLPAFAIVDDNVEKLDIVDFKKKFPEKYTK